MGRHLQMDWQTETQVVNKRYRLLGKQAAWKRLKAIRNARLTRRSAFCVSGKSSQQIASTASRGPMGCSRFWFLLGTFLNHPVVQFGRLWFSGNCQYSLGTTVLNFICKLGNWNPWNAQRVGEASNPGPGPGGSRSTERKRKEQTASQEADVSLATELLHVMEKFQSRGDEQGISAPPKKKGKGGNLVPQPKSNLATSLMQILQSALDNSWSDQEVIQRMQSKLTKVIAGNIPADSSESKTRRVTFDDPEQFPPLPSGTERRVRSQDSHSKSILRHPHQEPRSTKPNHGVGRSVVDDWSFGSIGNQVPRAPQENVLGLWPGSIRLNGIRPRLSPVFLKP